MNPEGEARTGRSFTPHHDAKYLYLTYLLAPTLAIGLMIVLVDGALVFYDVPGHWYAVLGLAIPYVLALAVVEYWIPRYLATVKYVLAEDRVIFEGGLWWRRKSFVPYNRITNIDIMQGPLSRHFGLGKVSIQTAGYSGQANSGVRLAEISIFGVKDFEGIKDLMMDKIARTKPVAVEAGMEPDHGRPDDEILMELRKIRRGIEDLSQRS